MPPAFAHRLRALLFIAVTVSVGQASAAIFVKIPKVRGDVQVSGYNDGTWFEAKSGSYGATRELPDSSTKGGTEDINLGFGDLKPLGLVAYLGRPTAALLQASINGNSIGDVEVHLADVSQGNEGETKPDVFGIIKLKQAFVKSFSIANAADERPWYTVEFIYGSLELTNVHTDPSKQLSDKEQTVSWNIQTETTKLSVVSHLKFADADKDGMSDDFEMTHFGSATAGLSSKDSDNDGESDLAEFLALTDPNDPESFFEVKIEEDIGEAMMIKMKTEPGRLYQLRSSDDLGAFILVGDTIGDGSEVEFVDPKPGTRRFYQVTLIPTDATKE